MIRRNLTPSLIVSVLALVVALGGVGYAASVLPKNSVGTKQLKQNAVVSKKVKDFSLLAKDFKKGQIPPGPQGPQGSQGPQGPQGAAGETGPRGPSAAYRVDKGGAELPLAAFLIPVVTTTTLPAGSYVLMSRANIAADGGAATVLCSIGNDAAQNFTIANSGLVPLAQIATVTLTAPESVSLRCLEQVGNAKVYQASITAIRVESLTTS